MYKNLSIIIVNYNARCVLSDCLDSLKNSGIDAEIFVVDNASEEKINDLEALYPEVKFIYNSRNLGFAAANNTGIKKAGGKYILLLNPDTIVNSNSFRPMMKYLDEHPETGIVGCKIFNKEGEIERSTHSFPSLLKEFVHANEFIKNIFHYDNPVMKKMKNISSSDSLASYWDHNERKVVDHVTGACMMLKREAVEKAGLLDEAFFLYNEEVEWSLRIKNAGYNSVFLPDSDIIHLFGHSTKQKVQRQTVNKLLVERYRGMFYFFRKHSGMLKLTLLRLIILQGFSFRLIANLLKMALNKESRKMLREENKYLRQIIGLAWLTDFDWRSDEK